MDCVGRNKEKRFLGVYNAIITEKRGAESELIFFGDKKIGIGSGSCQKTFL